MMNNAAVFKDRLERFRQWMKESGFDAFILTAFDEYMGEGVPPHNERLKWLTGFSGSMGELIIFQDRTIFFIDGRYTEQAQAELIDAYSVVDYIQVPIGKWCLENLSPGIKFGCYPWILSVARGRRMHEIITSCGGEFGFTQVHPVDEMWGEERPAAPIHPIVPHPLVYAGQRFEEKIEQLQKNLQAQGIDYYVHNNLSAICWLLNIRGADCENIPVPYVYAVIPAQGQVELFFQPRGGQDVLEAYFGEKVKMGDEALFPARLAELSKTTATLAFDHLETPYGIDLALTGAGTTRTLLDDPVALPRALKNVAEVEGARLAHLHDGLALVRTFHWIHQNVGHICEWDAHMRLVEERSKCPFFKMPSFGTIAGFGPHSAMAHYRPKPEFSLKIAGSGFFLIDSGGQYLMGTTDVTRTLAIGHLSEAQKDTYTRVLKGHIGLAKAVFPRGTRGWQLDTLARMFLWEKGLGYKHATGHGVGSYLCVHEAPPYISCSARLPSALEPGMIVSNEPGYYREGEFGSRIESLMVVVPHAVEEEETQEPMLCFETMTLAPIDTRPIVKELMLAEEVAWLNAYHHRVWAALSPHLEEEPDVKDWLYAACRPL